MTAAPNTVRFAVLIVKTEDGYAAAVPDLLGCAVNGSTVGLAQHAIRIEAQRHVARLREQGLSVPAPSSQIGYVELAVN
jgi:predicted RNase H-like HicB family nuclease